MKYVLVANREGHFSVCCRKSGPFQNKLLKIGENTMSKKAETIKPEGNYLICIDGDYHECYGKELKAELEQLHTDYNGFEHVNLQIFEEKMVEVKVTKTIDVTFK